jgi:hypothetical protein
MYKEAFESREDLKEFGDNALLLFALILKYGYDDITQIASESITDGNDDKKADLILVDLDKGFAVIAQSYMSRNEDKPSAKANKAADLNTAMNWIFNSEIGTLPQTIKAPTIELRNAIKNGQISDIQIWYVHNLPESDNCKSELQLVEQAAVRYLKANFPDRDGITIQAIEVGNNTINEWYRTTNTPILVNSDISFEVPGGYELAGDDWESFSTTIAVRDLYVLYKRYDKDLFSANVRDYLGIIKSDLNINNNIKRTAINEPGKFCVYNNGLTMITHDFSYDKKKHLLQLKGLSIVNGAQTTGSIGTLLDVPDSRTFVLARFIKCTDNETIQNIVRYNNSQNKINATDFRSNDPIQSRLRNEFAAIGTYVYLGGRRGGVDDAIRRQPNLLPSDSVAQALAAFHGSPNVAYNKKSEIWNKDDLYSAIFNEKTTARHILFVYSVFYALKELKLDLFRKAKNESTMIPTEKKQLDFLRLRGGNYLYMAALSSCLESMLQKKVPNKFRIAFKDIPKQKDFSVIWEKVINSTLPFSDCLYGPTQKSLGVIQENEQAINTFKSFIEATIEVNKSVYEELNNRINIL